MIKNHKHIVFCEEHYNPLGLVRSLGEYGIRSYVISTSSKPQMIRKSKYIQEYIFAECIHDAYKILMDRFGNEDLRPFLYTSDDIRTSFLDERYEELKDKFYFFNAGSNGRITYFMDKDNINKLAMKHGLNVLKSIKVERGVIPEGLEYPIITKSISSTVGGWKNDVFICHNENELKKAYERIKAHTVLIQKYIEKKNELCLDGFSANNGKDVLFAIASNYNYILPDTYSSYMKIFNFTDRSLEINFVVCFQRLALRVFFQLNF